jgi:hypothetical protein
VHQLSTRAAELEIHNEDLRTHNSELQNDVVRPKLYCIYNTVWSPNPRVLQDDLSSKVQGLSQDLKRCTDDIHRSSSHATTAEARATEVQLQLDAAKKTQSQVRIHTLP